MKHEKFVNRKVLTVGTDSSWNESIAKEHLGVEEVFTVADLSAMLALEAHSIRKFFSAGLPHVYVENKSKASHPNTLWERHHQEVQREKIFTSYPLLEQFLMESCDAYVELAHITVQDGVGWTGEHDLMKRKFVHTPKIQLSVEHQQVPLSVYPKAGHFVYSLMDTRRHTVERLRSSLAEHSDVEINRWYTLKELPVILGRSMSSTSLLRYLLPSFLFRVPGSTMYLRRVQLAGEGTLREQINSTMGLLRKAYKAPIVSAETPASL